MDTFLYFFKHGFYQVLDWNSYSHVIFLIVLLASCTIKYWVKSIYLISIFTICYSLAIFLSGYDLVSIKEMHSKVFISIVLFVMAVTNIFSSGNDLGGMRNKVYFIFAIVLGLLYGLNFIHNFENVLSSNNRFISVLQYGVGIEVGQLIVGVAILLLAFIFQTVFRFSKRDWILILSSIVIGLLIPSLIENKIW